MQSRYKKDSESTGLIRYDRFRVVLVVVVLLTSSIPAALFGSYLLSSPSLNAKTPSSVRQAGFTGLAQLGIDCGYGSNEAVANVTGYPGPDGAQSSGNAGGPTLDTSCSWAGSPDIPLGGTQLQPLVSDNPTVTSGTSCCASPSKGGGFTAEVVFIQNSSSVINGFDVSLSWDTKILSAVEFDQGGTPFGAGCPAPSTCASFTATNIIDNTLGQAELSQAILAPPAPSATVAGNITLFRLRFDVVGIGTTNLHLFNDQIINANLTPNNVHHDLFQGSFVSSNIPDLVSGLTLGYTASWTFTPNPEVPGSLLTLIAATSACPGCTGALTYSWDVDSMQCYPDTASPCVAATIEATGQSASITAPTATLLAHRVTLIVTDAAGNQALATRRLPLAVSPPPSQSVAINVAASLTAKWLGGIPPYSGTTGQVGVKWLLCNSTGLTQTICTNPNPSTTSTPAQMVTVSNTYKWAGVFTGTVQVTDTQEPQLPGPNIVGPTSFLVNVTGTPQAYTVTPTSNATAGATTAQVVNFTAPVAYATTPVVYNTAARSATFSYTFLFGDGQIGLFSGQTIGKATHKYANPGTYTVVVIAQETGSNALAKIQEVGRFMQTINPAGTGLCSTPCSITFSPTSPTVGQTVTFTANVNGGVAPFTFSWSFGDGTPNVAGNPATHMYSAKGTFTVKVNITDSSTPTHQTSTVTTTITVLPTPLADTVSGPASGTVGTSVTFTVAANGGTSPYTFSWTATGGSPASGSGASFSTTYSVKGTYVVNATVTDFNGAKAFKTASITINPLPLADTVTGPTSGTVGTSVTFTAGATGGTTPYTFSWTAVGGSPASGSGASLTTTYSVKGTYVVNATVTDLNGVKAFKTASITINPLALTVAVTGPISGTVGTAVTFNAAAGGGTSPYTFTWTAVGGSPASGSGASFTTTYSVKGTYVVNATVTDFNAKKAFKTASITINPLPLADTVSGPTSGTVGIAVTFNAAGTGGTAPYTFSWTAVGGSPASGSGASFTTTYSVKGTYTVNATVTDFNGAKAFKTASITINPLALADTVTGPTSGTVGTAVTFNAAATGGTTPYTFSWTAVGGSPASGTGASFTTTYSVKGTYVVNATVTDFNAKKAFKTAVITINPLALADTVTGPTSGTVGTAVTFNAAATGGTTPYTFTWTAVGGSPASGGGASFTTTYSVKGTYVVNATVTDLNGAKAFKTASITINPLALADTVTGPTSGTVGTAVTFNAAATGGTTPYTFAWTAVGGSPASGTGTSFTTTYSVKGTYVVNATVTDFKALQSTHWRLQTRLPAQHLERLELQ